MMNRAGVLIKLCLKPVTSILFRHMKQYAVCVVCQYFFRPSILSAVQAGFWYLQPVTLQLIGRQTSLPPSTKHATNNNKTKSKVL